MHKFITGSAVWCAVGLGALILVGCSSQPDTPTEAAGNQVAMSFDLSKCESLGPSLYQCPGSDKAICTPEYNRGDVECVKADEHGVLIQNNR